MYTLGIDIGSTTSKCVILQDGASITARSLQLGGLGTDGPEDALTELWQESGLTRADMAASSSPAMAAISSRAPTARSAN